MTAALHDAVATRAYHIWEGEGRPHGRHEHHWFAAEVAALREAAEVRAAEPAAVEAPATALAAPTKVRAPAKKAPAAKKAAPVNAAAPTRKPAPKAPAEAVVAAAALSTPRTTRAAMKGPRNAH